MRAGPMVSCYNVRRSYSLEIVGPRDGTDGSRLFDTLSSGCRHARQLFRAVGNPRKYDGIGSGRPCQSSQMLAVGFHFDDFCSTDAVLRLLVWLAQDKSKSDFMRVLRLTGR